MAEGGVGLSRAQGIHDLSLWEACQVSEIYRYYWNTHIRWRSVRCHRVGFLFKAITARWPSKGQGCIFPGNRLDRRWCWSHIVVTSKGDGSCELVLGVFTRDWYGTDGFS